MAPTHGASVCARGPFVGAPECQRNDRGVRVRPGSLVSRQTPPLPELLRCLFPYGVVDQVPETPRGEHDPATLAGATALEDLDRVPVDPAIC